MSVSGTLRRQLTPLEPAVRRIESAKILDRPGKVIGQKIRQAVPPGPARELLSGTWLGHAVHPMLTDVVIGSFLSASLLDFLNPKGDGRGSERLIGVGIAAYAPTALTGVSDWGDSEPADDGVRRAGLVHATCNAVALSLYTASLLARRRGARGRGVLLGGGGATVLALGAYLGGHLTLRKGVGADQTVFDPGPSEWTTVADASLLSDGQPTRVVADDTPVLLIRDGEQIFAIHDRCSHRGCSLSEGEVDGDEVVCPCHGSRFDRRDGSLKRGPATAPQPAFQVRRRDALVEIRRLSAGSP